MVLPILLAFQCFESQAQLFQTVLTCVFIPIYHVQPLCNMIHMYHVTKGRLLIDKCLCFSNLFI